MSEMAGRCGLPRRHALTESPRPYSAAPRKREPITDETGDEVTEQREWGLGLNSGSTGRRDWIAQLPPIDHATRSRRLDDEGAPRSTTASIRSSALELRKYNDWRIK